MSSPARPCSRLALGLASLALAASASAQEAFTAGNVFLGNDEGEVWEVTPDGELVETYTLDDDEPEVLSLVFGPDGRLVALLDGGKLVALSPDGSVADLVESGVDTSEGGLVVAPDGSLMVTANNSLRRFDVTGTSVATDSLDSVNENEVGGLAFGPGGNLYVLANESNAGTRRTQIFEFDSSLTLLSSTLLDTSFSPPVGGLVRTPEGDLFGLLPDATGGPDLAKIEVEDDGTSVELVDLDDASAPRALTLGPGGTLWVSDPDADTVFVLDDEGEVLATFDDGDAFEGIQSMATAPYRYRASVRGELWVDEDDLVKLRVKDAELAVSPGEGLVTLWLPGGPDDAALRTAFGGARGWVFHGVEHGQGEAGKRVLFQGGQVLAPALELGTSLIDLRIDGSTDEETERFVPKKAGGSLLRSSPDGAFRAKIRAAKRL